MKRISRLLCGVVLSSVMMSTAIANEGKVISSINTGGYTYVEVSLNGHNSWLAAPGVNLKPGNIIRFDEGATMSNFYSKSLNRNFPSILFVQQVDLVKEK